MVRSIYTFFLYFAQLQHAYQTVSEENAENKQALLAARHKDETSSAMINELTQVNAAKSTSSKFNKLSVFPCRFSVWKKVDKINRPCDLNCD